MIRHLLIDADYLIYKECYGAEVETDWGSDFWTLHCDFGEVKSNFTNRVEAIKKTLGADKATLVLSDSANFRRQLNPSYKSNRDGKRKPVCLSAARKWVHEELGGLRWPRLEADDVLGILATEPQKTEDRIIVSVDKDFKGVPGKFYRLRPGADPEKIIVAPEEADYWQALQTLTGDTVDGYSGCPGCGAVTAEKILKAAPRDAWWTAIVSQYTKKGLTEADALLNARMAHVLRSGEYNTKTNKIKLWTSH